MCAFEEGHMPLDKWRGLFPSMDPSVVERWPGVIEKLFYAGKGDWFFEKKRKWGEGSDYGISMLYHLSIEVLFSNFSTWDLTKK